MRNPLDNIKTVIAHKEIQIAQAEVQYTRERQAIIKEIKTEQQDEMLAKFGVSHLTEQDAYEIMREHTL